MLVLAVLLCFVYASIITDAFMFGVVSPRKRASLFMRPSESELSENAQRALDECNGDVNMATQVIFQRDDAEDDRVRTWNAIAEFLDNFRNAIRCDSLSRPTSFCAQKSSQFLPPSILPRPSGNFVVSWYSMATE